MIINAVFLCIFLILVDHDKRLMSRVIWMRFGLLSYSNMMNIKTKTCGDGNMIYKVDKLTACYLNYCSKIIGHGRMSLRYKFN